MTRLFQVSSVDRAPLEQRQSGQIHCFRTFLFLYSILADEH
jgi:hypothetical protein